MFFLYLFFILGCECLFLFIFFLFFLSRPCYCSDRAEQVKLVTFVIVFWTFKSDPDLLFENGECLVKG